MKDTLPGIRSRLQGMNAIVQCQTCLSEFSIRHLIAALTLGLVIARWQAVYFSYSEPPLWIVAFVLALCLGLLRLVPSLVWGWWAAGALTLAWSVAPGNTLVSSLWELAYVAAFAAGFWRGGFWIVSMLLLLSGLDRTLLLSAFGLTQFVSGSIHYVAGAQALVLVPLAFATVVRPGKPLVRVGSAGILLAGTFLAMSSGARAVYLPLALIIVALAVRLWMELQRPLIVLGVMGALAGGIAGLNALIPQHPISLALGRGATVEAQVRASSEYGGFTQRLRFWDQTIDIALEHPFGAGTGSYQSIIHSYQKYPMVWSASPHNYYVETAATGGWVRALLLVALLVIPSWRAWRSRNWPWALAAGGIWMTLAFDVTSYYPIFMMYAFAALGAAHFVTRRTATAEGTTIGTPTTGRSRRLRTAFAVTCFACGVGLAAWWYLPCEGTSCVTTRYLGAEFKARPKFAEWTPEVRTEMLARLRALNPESIWVLRIEQAYAETPAEKFAIAREIATRFPYQHPENFLAWADTALALGDVMEAKAAVSAGLAVFPDDRYPYGERRMTRDRYQHWVDEAYAILALGVP